MNDELYLGSSPAYEEECASVGEPDYYPRARAECKALIGQLRRMFGPEPVGAGLSIKGSIKGCPHDFGTYLEVVCRYDPDNEEATDYAFRLESSGPDWWDEEATKELGLKKRSES